jgi:hypothetical protein
MMLSKQCAFISMSKSTGNSDISRTQIFLSTANRDPHHLLGGLFFLYMSFVINVTVKWMNSEQNTRRTHGILRWKNPLQHKEKNTGGIQQTFTISGVLTQRRECPMRRSTLIDGLPNVLWMDITIPTTRGGGGALAPPLPRHYYRAHHMGLTAQASQHKVLLHSSEINPLLYKFGSEQIKLLKIFPTDRKMGCGVVPRDHSGNPILLCS